MRKKKDPKTIRGWLMRLPEPVKSLALANMKGQGRKNWQLPEYMKLPNALEKAFDWGRTPEGTNYWLDIALKPEHTVQKPIEIAPVADRLPLSDDLIKTLYSSGQKSNMMKSSEKIETEPLLASINQLVAGQRMLLDNYIEQTKKIADLNQMVAKLQKLLPEDRPATPVEPTIKPSPLGQPKCGDRFVVVSDSRPDDMPLWNDTMKTCRGKTITVRSYDPKSEIVTCHTGWKWKLSDLRPETEADRALGKYYPTPGDYVICTKDHGVNILAGTGGIIKSIGPTEVKLPFKSRTANGLFGVPYGFWRKATDIEAKEIRLELNKAERAIKIKRGDIVQHGKSKYTVCSDGPTATGVWPLSLMNHSTPLIEWLTRDEFEWVSNGK